jgi:hypothetical protein
VNAARPGQPRPDFEPPAGPEPLSAVQEQSATPRRRIGVSRFAGRLGLLVVVVTIAIAFSLLHRGDDPIAKRTSRPSAVTTPSLTHPLPTTRHRPADPLLQQTWTSRDDVYPMDLRRFTFSFRAPGSWGCMASSQAGARWVCIDETGLLNGTRPVDPSGGIIESDECTAPCTAKGYADVRARLRALGVDTAGLHVVDGRTRLDDRVDPSDPAQREYRMSRLYDSNGDGRLDRHLWVRIDVNAADRIAVQKMLGDLYDATA